MINKKWDVILESEMKKDYFMEYKKGYKHNRSKSVRG